MCCRGKPLFTSRRLCVYYSTQRFFCEVFYVAQASLYDIRDNNEYVVRKLADGNCWMSENLRLTFTTSTTLTPSDSDVAEDWTPGVVTETAENNTVWGPASQAKSNVDNVHSYSAGDSTLLDVEGNARKIGTYYNWHTATASSGTYEITENNAEYSICPKNWKLPTADEGQSLISLYNYSGNLPLLIVLSLKYVSQNGGLDTEGTNYGELLTSTPGDEGHTMKAISRPSNNTMRIGLHYARYHGRNVRCIVR